MTSEGDAATALEPAPQPAWATLAIAVAPVALLAALATLLATAGLDWLKRPEAPPVEDLSITWVTLKPEQFQLRVVNNGPDPVTIAQVMVDEAYWSFTVEPEKPLAHLEQALVTIPYPWVTGEAHEIRLVTSAGATFDAAVDVALESPGVSPRSVGVFAAIGALIGVAPVALGLLWLPALRRLSAAWLRFFLALTAGLLIFLGVDTIHEGWKQAATLPSSYQGVALLVSLAVATSGGLMLLGAMGEAGAASGRRAGALAMLIAIGIGLHNLGEGLAVGGAYAVGEASLGAALILGFAVHNLTEGLAIATPIAKTRVRLGRLVWLCAVAGAPTIFGAWVGAFTQSSLWAVVFFGVAAGAIVQVAHVVVTSEQVGGWGRLMARPASLSGLLAGMAVMYATGLFVAA